MLVFTPILAMNRLSIRFLFIVDVGLASWGGALASAGSRGGQESPAPHDNAVHRKGETVFYLPGNYPDTNSAQIERCCILWVFREHFREPDVRQTKSSLSVLRCWRYFLSRCIGTQLSCLGFYACIVLMSELISH
jgi:hypothetical protein